MASLPEYPTLSGRDCYETTDSCRTWTLRALTVPDVVTVLNVCGLEFVAVGRDSVITESSIGPALLKQMQQMWNQWKGGLGVQRRLEADHLSVAMKCRIEFCFKKAKHIFFLKILK